MAKQLNVNMSFSADTNQAKAQLQDLQRQLNNLMSIKKAPGIGLDVEIDKAAKSVAELSTHLKQATNIDTGNLDFSKLNQSLKQSGKSLQEYASTLKSLGPSGEQAFMSLARSVSQAEIPTRRTNALLKEMATTIANTARWQISSSILHGLMGGLQSAYGYAKDLNESLNNIRIVTNKSVDDMKDFAEQANKAAKSLSSTTTAYTDASLIYYQQGLGEAEVAKRAETTLKMANVSRQSAQVVSDQMTAIWSNFADGSHELEYYADVLTALGAATASSSDEISQGLEKFSAVADTVGLSYEYAASALATVTAETRQSADVVGTAFKTLFARIEGLKLGETLEDGTDLNKYSEALLSVGINIKDQNGELRQMDAILNDMGAKWQTLGKDQQVALAQTVGGVRQYNTLISLMDNWNKFQQNLNTSYTSEGTLNTQAEIYADSWEAASNRVKASAEGIYQSLINDEFFIDLLNSLEKILEFTDKLIENLGGVSGVLTVIGAIVTKVFSNELSKGLTNLAYNFRMMTKSGREKEEQTRQKFINDAASQIPKTIDYSLPTEKASQTHLKHQLTLQSDYLKNADKMSQFEQETNKALIERTRILNEQSVAAAKNLEQSQEQLGLAEEALRINAITKNKDGITNNHQSEVNQFKKNVKYNVQLQDEVRTLGREAAEGLKIERTAEDQQKIVEDFKQKIKEIKARLQKEMEKEEIPIDLNLDILDNFNDVDIDPKVLEEKMSNVIVDLESGLKDVSKDFKDTTMEGKTKQEKQSVDNYIVDKKREVAMRRENERAIGEEKTAYESAQKSINNAQGAQKQWTDILVEGANVAFSVATAVQMIGSAWDTIKDPDVSGWEKFTTVLTTMSMLIPTMISSLRTMKDLFSLETIVKIANVSATQAQVKAERDLNNERGETPNKTKRNIKDTIKDTKNKWNNSRKNMGSTWNTGAWDKLNDEDKQRYRDLAWDKLSNTEKSKYDNMAFSKMGKSEQAAFLKSKGLSSTKAGKAAHGSGASSINKQKTEAIKGLGKAEMGDDAAKSLAGKEALAGLGSSLASLGIVLVAVAVAVGSITLAIKIFNKEADEAKRAAEMANKSTETFQNTKAAYDDLANTLTAYQDAEKSLASLTEGTDEYRQKLLEANEAALKLVNSNNLIAGQDYEVMENGLIKIDKAAQERVQKNELYKLEKAQAHQISMNSYAKQQQLEADRTEFNRKYAKGSGWSSEDTAWMLGAAGAGAATGAILGTVVPVIGNAIGWFGGAMVGLAAGAITGAVGSIVGDDAEKEENEALEILQKAYDKKGLEALTKGSIRAELEGKVSERLIKSLEDNWEETQKQVQALSENTKAINAMVIQTAKSANEENELYQNLTQQEQGVADIVIANRVDEILADTNSDEYVEEKKKVKKLFHAGDKEEEIYDEYIAARFGKEQAENYRVTKRGGKKATLQQLVDGIWTDVDEELKNDEVIAKVTENRLKMMQDIDKTIVEKLGTEGQNLQEKIKGLTSDESYAIQRDLANGDGVLDLSLLSPEKIEQLHKAIQAGTSDISEEYLLQFKKAVKNYKPEDYEKIKEAEYTSELSTAATELGVEEEVLRGYTDALIDNNKAFKDNKKAAVEAAKSLINFTKGTEELQSALDDNLEILQEWNEDAFETYEVAGEVQGALEKMFGVKVSSTFVKDNLSDIQKAAEGDVEAIERLGKLAAKDYIINLNIDESGKTALNNLIDDLSKQDISMGATVDVSTGISELNRLLEAGEITADQVNEALGAIGYNAEVEMKKVDSEPVTTTSQSSVKWNNIPLGEVSSVTTTESSIEVPVIKSEKGTKGSGTFTRISTPKTKSSSTGSITKPDAGNDIEPAEHVNKSDTVERYKEINDQLEDTSRLLDKINDKMNDSYGQARLDAMDEYIDKLKEENKLLEKKDKEINKNLKSDKQTVADAAAGVGMSVQFDKNSNIANATQIEEAWYARLSKATTKDEQEEIQRQIDIWEDAQSEYEDSLNEFWDNEDAKRENKRKQQQQQYDKWSYKIELDVELDESELALIDYYKEKYSDNIYNIAESTALTGQQIDITLQNLAQREKDLAELSTLYEQGKISQAQYAEGLKELQEKQLEDLTTLKELKKETEEYYRTTLQMAQEEIDKYNDRLERTNKLLEHYQTMLELTGQEQNYDAIGTILEAQQKSIENQYKSNKKTLEMYQDEYDKTYARYLMTDDLEEKENLKKSLEQLEGYIIDAQDRIFENEQQKAENAAAIRENALNRIRKQTEEALTGGRSFDELSMLLEHSQSTQEEYLTTTNKIYETTKMMRNLQNEIDKTTNNVAKQKLKAFQQETKQLQEQGKLSKFELDIQQAKYDLLLAEIALEEAQKAKSTVRLQRDSEGNFGYVYTADQEKISSAQQAVDDAKNKLYNVQLNGANKYAEEALKARQEFTEKMTKLEQNKLLLSEEEYQRRREEIINYYTQKLSNTQELYSIAVADDARVMSEAWTSNIEGLILDVDTFKTVVQNDMKEVDTVNNTFNTTLQKIAEEAGVSLDQLAEHVANVTNESDKWSDEFHDEVIPGLKDAVEEVDDLAIALMKKLTPQIKDATKQGEELAKQMQQVQKKLATVTSKAEKSGDKASTAAGQWKDYWNAVNNTDGDTGGSSGGGGNISGSSGGGSKKVSTNDVAKSNHTALKIGDSLTITAAQVTTYSSSTWKANGHHWDAMPGTTYKVYDAQYHNGYWFYRILGNVGGESVWLRQDQIPWSSNGNHRGAGFDTGGYTGEWGSEGKLAMLHEKEIILNKEDTKNFLASLELLHNIIKMIDINTSNSLISRLDSADLKTNKSNDILEQHVTIEAVFPNVEDRYEIEEAFMNLTNEASQYINRKNN